MNLAGAIQAVNADASTITLTDAATRKPMVISVTPDSEVKKLDPAVAQRIAARLSGAKRPDGAPGALRRVQEGRGHHPQEPIARRALQLLEGVGDRVAADLIFSRCWRARHRSL